MSASVWASVPMKITRMPRANSTTVSLSEASDFMHWVRKSSAENAGAAATSDLCGISETGRAGADIGGCSYSLALRLLKPERLDERFEVSLLALGEVGITFELDEPDPVANVGN